MCRFLTFAIAVLISSAVQAEEIPLKSIWAWDMPGTRKFPSYQKTASGEYVSKDGLVAHEIATAFTKLAREEDSKAAFAVAGEGEEEALQSLRSALVSDKVPRSTFYENEAVNLVFFTLEYGADVHLREVKMSGNTINLAYRFAPHFEANVGNNYALIPLGRLPKGEYSVTLTQLPFEKKYVDLKVKPISEKKASRVVCKPFRFVVLEPKKEQ